MRFWGILMYSTHKLVMDTLLNKNFQSIYLYIVKVSRLFVYYMARMNMTNRNNKKLELRVESLFLHIVCFHNYAYHGSI